MITETNGLNVSQIFLSLEGEGAFVGIPSVFVRLGGCNLSCAYCDTRTSKGVDLSFDRVSASILDAIRSTEFGKKGVIIPYSITWTGGEPLLQVKTIREFKQALNPEFGLGDSGTEEGIREWWTPVMRRIAQSLWRVHTNGTLPIPPELFQSVSITPKTLGYVQRTRLMEVVDAGALVEIKVMLDGTLDPNDVREEFIRAISEIRAATNPLFGLGYPSSFYVQPIFPEGGNLERYGKEEWKQLRGNLRKAVDWVKNNSGWKLSLQTQKLLSIQ